MAEDKGLSRSAREEQVLQFWKDNSIFKKSLEKPAPAGDFVFYDGPPGANGRPGIHHLESRFFKDAIPRYKTMQGFRVPRRAGWDTHGLPVEIETEKTLGLKSKKEIEAYGIAAFNDACKKVVWKYVDEWERITDRTAYWVDQEHAYVTYHNAYMEKVWEVVAHVNDRGLLYKDYKVLPWCTRCGTALSSHELAQGYQDVKDLSLYVKFKIVGTPNGYFVAWTTTPWTLPGNVALAVGPDIDYVEASVGDEILVVAKEKLSLLGEAAKVVAEHKGSEMVGMEYEPLYDFIENNGKAFRVYTADFVNTEDGTGIVHTAVMYGQDDFELGNNVGLPKVHLVSPEGLFIAGTGWFEGRSVVDPELAVDVLKDLQAKGAYLHKENHLHSYPFCWRCKTRLIYYARDSWYIRMSELRDELQAENEKINWEPDYIKRGRFGEWLREVKDWAVSRERYWGTPLPVWESPSGKRIVVKSIKSLKTLSQKNGNTFVFVRHGEAENNTGNICNSDPNVIYHLTEKGRAQALEAAHHVGRVDEVYVSPYVRTRETAEIIAAEVGYRGELHEDARLAELDFGDFNGKPFSDFLEYESKYMPEYDTALPGGESYAAAKKRFGEFLYSTDALHRGKTILVVTHGMGLEAVAALIEGANLKRSKEIIESIDVKPGQVLSFEFVPLPHNAEFELDMHRPYIDAVTLEHEGEIYTRVKEVMDVWFDSGVVPFAQNVEFGGEIDYPANFIAEGLDQTRGWFYTLHAVGVLMGRGRAFENVICLGLILDEKGKKMSKSVGNVVDPWEMIEKYGVDVLRLWMYSINQPGENKSFDERSVDEIQKRVFNLLDNVYSFYALYTDQAPSSSVIDAERGVLDEWILVRLDETVGLMTEKLDAYKLLEPVRALRDFIDDLSTWYVRRSRDRIKEGDLAARQTLRTVLFTISKLLAPFAPFAAEELYQKLRLPTDPQSVHLETWPAIGALTATTMKAEDVVRHMQTTRKLVTLALEARSKANLKVRQPLRELKLRTTDLPSEYLDIIKDELNVKTVTVDVTILDDVWLDTTLTDELVEEGRVRDLIRALQELRKVRDMSPSDVLVYEVPASDMELFSKYAADIKRAANVSF